jgi:hypothetical protein
MDLRNAILKENTKAQAIKITNWVDNDKDRFALLIDLFLHDEYRVVQRAAWIVSMVANKYPELLTPHLPAMIKRMHKEGLPTAVKRNVVRILQNVKIPGKLQGPVMDACFQFLSDPKETIAVRCFSMTVLANLAKDYSEIKGELKIAIEEVLRQKARAGLRARAKKVLLNFE